MQNKGFVKIFAVLLTLVCLFYLSFSFVVSHEEDKIESWANKVTGEWVAQKDSLGETVTEKQKTDYFKEKKEEYLEKNKDKKVWLGVYTLQKCRELQIGLGLDLKGGLSVTLEVSAPDFLKSLTAGVQDSEIEAAIRVAQQAAENNGDAIDAFVKALPEGRSLASIFANSVLKDKISLNSTNEAVVDVIRGELKDAVDNSYSVIRSRVDRFGVAQPNIQKLGGGQGRIMVELPGVENKQRVIELLTRSSNLQFWEAYTANEIKRVAIPSLKRLGLDEFLVENADGIVAYADAAGKDKINDVLNKAKELDENPIQDEVLLCWSANSENGIYTLYALKDEDGDGIAPLQGNVVSEAKAGFKNNHPCVNMAMTRSAEGIWAEMTEKCANSKRPIAVVLDREVYCAPVPSERIGGGHSEITGNFTIEETQDLATVLCSGKMLVPLRDVESNVVGPSIGEASIQQGLMSFIVAFILLMIYMCAIYGVIPGMVANGALLLNLFFTLGILASFQAALTMSGIAGIVLTLGMAVDANVLIYERAKEELRAGKNVRLALADGYKNAFSAILDSNLTSIITGVILYFFGTGPIKGFAITLIIGLLCSFFTAVFVTRVVYEHFHNKNKWMGITFSTKFSNKIFRATNFNFIRASKKTAIVVAVAAVAMIVSFSVRGMAKSIEFTGGRNYVVKFEQKVSDGEIQSLIKKEITDANVQVISYGTDGDQVRISTNYLINKLDADSLVEKKIYDALKNGGKLADDVTFERFRNTEDDRGGSIKSSQMVDSTVAEEISDSAVTSVIWALLAIFIYIFARFRNIAYSVGSISALALDVLMIMGCYSLLYGVLPMSLELDQTFIGAILTAIGYSINDKVVVFDRVREFNHLYPKRDKMELFNTSLNTTLARTLNTSFSTLLVLLCIFILGGDSIRSFSFAMILGVIFGTLSSLFIAAPIAYSMVSRQVKKAKK